MSIRSVPAAASGAIPLPEVAVHLHPQDDVAIAKVELQEGLTLRIPGARPPVSDRVVVRQSIPSGHKVALHALASGGPVRRYGQVIGFATADISAGEHVHTHNLSAPLFDREYDIGVDVPPGAPGPRGQAAHLYGLCAPQRARGHAQHDRRDLERQLFGPRHAPDRPPLDAQSGWRPIPTWTA